MRGLSVVAACSLVFSVSGARAEEYLNGIKWSEPPVVTPGESGAQPPSDAVVLFNGKDLSNWKNGENWQVKDGAFYSGKGPIVSEEEFGDCQLHIEWATPFEVKGNGQGRGNSGVFLMGLYEIQVLDGYDNPTYADGITGAIYGQFPPLVNATRPPGEWQAYDIIFEAPVYEGETLKSPAYLTVILNGILLHNRKEAMGPTGHKNLSSYGKVHGPTGPLKLQDHGDLVRYRNIWIRNLTDYDAS